MNKFNHASSYFRICIDKIEDINASGKVYSQRLLKPFSFYDIKDLIMKIEFVLDKQNFPRAYEQKRSFNELFIPTDILVADCLANGTDKTFISNQKGKEATFDLYVITRRNTTWQGYIINNGKKIEFNSVLELLRIIKI